jgi:hypothetical protein
VTLLFGLLACQTAEFPAPIAGTAYRIEDDVPADGSEVRVDLMTTWNECAEAKVLDMDACVPRADRASGELHLSFRLRDPQSPTDIFRAITADQIRVTHDKSTQTDFELVPHEPIGSGQLYVIVLDGSGSMYKNDGERVKKVYSALLKPSVVDRFFPPDNPKTGVVFMRFQDEVLSLDGGPIGRILTTRREYEDMVRTHLMKPSGGFTHLYDAIRFTVTELLEQDAIRDFLAVKAAEPTVILVTDGFNNQAADDTCATNAPRLQQALDLLRDVRSNQGGSTRPTIYTLGLGVPYRKGDKPAGLNRQVTPRDLCGKYEDYRIDTVLDGIGIDHVSLQWIAEVGGGRSFVKNKANGLAETLEAAAATRYRWYEVWYRVPDSFYHRKSFDVEVQLRAYDRAVSTVRVHPSSWMDAPTAGHATGARWHTATPFLHSLTILMPALGLLVLLNFVAPATFNARRAIFRRARPRSRTR